MIVISTKVVYNIISDNYIFITKGNIMSFDISGPSPVNKPMIQESQNMQNDGGAGNLGYFKRGKQKKKKEDELDSFELSTSADTFESEFAEIDEEVDFKSIANKIKGFFKKKSE